MTQRYEYKFVRMGESWWGVKGEAKHGYQDEIHRHAKEGWRLVQIFAPGVATQGWAKFYELVFERQV